MFWPTRTPFSSTLAIGGEEGARVILPVIPPSGERTPEFKDPVRGQRLPGYETNEAGKFTGHAAHTEIKRDPETGEAFGVATNSGAYRYPWGIERYDDVIEHRTSDENPAHTSTIGRYSLTEELEDRTLDFEQIVEFTSNEENFRLKFHRRLLVNGELFREKIGDEVIPRDFQ